MTEPNHAYPKGAAKKLRAEFDTAIQAMQAACPHAELSEPMPYMWAPGHYGAPVRACEVCDKLFPAEGTEV